MVRKLFAVAVLFVLSILAVGIQESLAVGPCTAAYCAGKPASAKCGCPPGTDFPGRVLCCGCSWRACWGE
jgi:hypothetical protein